MVPFTFAVPFLPSRLTSSRLRALALAAAGGCLPFAGPAGAEEVLRVGGTGSALGAMARIGTALEQEQPGVRFRVLPSLGSTGAIEAVAEGALDVGRRGRPLKDSERGRGVIVVEMARTPFVFAVGRDAGVGGITSGDLAAIYRGEKLTWPNGQRIRVILRPASDADTDLLKGISPEISAAVTAAHGRPGMLVAVTNTECHQILGRSPGSIGPTTLLQLRTDPLPSPPLEWNGVAPTLGNLASGRYPLVKSIYLVVRSRPPPAVRQILAFLSSPRGRKLLLELGAQPVDLPRLE
jgi:phosphate transport system substrate-binding protein